MYTSVFISLGAIVAMTSAVDLERIQADQMPQKNFDPDKYGRDYWFTQGRYIPCTFSGSKQFTDVAYRLELRGQSYVSDSYWRSDGVCTNIVSNVNPQSPGVFLQKDPIGNLYSGRWVIIATDYKKFSVSWGCTKPSATGEKCVDPYIIADTRHPHPDAYTLKIIDRILKDRFGLSLKELTPSTQDDPCVKHLPSPKKHYHHLKRKY